MAAVDATGRTAKAHRPKTDALYRWTTPPAERRARVLVELTAVQMAMDSLDMKRGNDTA